MVRGGRFVLISVLMVAGLLTWGCASGGGGGGGAGVGGGGDEAPADAPVPADGGDENLTDGGDDLPEDPSASEGTEGDGTDQIGDEDLIGCGGDPAFAHGANELPHYDLMPTPAIPRLVRERERPAAVDLSAFVPTPCNQGDLRACVAWTGAYGLMTFLAAENLAGWVDLDRTDRHFSPAFAFNLSNSFQVDRSPFDNCLAAGAYLSDLFILLRDTGCVTWLDMPYAPDECETMPSEGLIERAGHYRIEYFRATERDVITVQSYLDQRVAVVAVLVAGPEFLTLGPDSVYTKVEVDDEESFAHAVLAVGYDDELAAVKVMNSWGTRWGDGGFGFVSYDVWEEVVAEAYVVGRELATDLESVDDSSLAKPTLADQEIAERSCAQSPLFDQDGDGYPDTLEREFAALGFDPAEPNDNPDFGAAFDSDGDGWPDATEIVYGTDRGDVADFPFDCDYEYPEGFFAEDAGDRAFSVTGVDLPTEVVSDGARGDLKVFWEGDPVFPVTLEFRPAPGGCPAGTVCQTLTADFIAPANPLDFTEAVWCTNQTSGVEFGYEVVLIDALGNASEAVPAGFNCLPL